MNSYKGNKHRGVVQVGVYRNHELVLELQRDRQNQIVKTYPVREQTKELAATDQRSQLDVLKEVVSDKIQGSTKSTESRQGMGTVTSNTYIML